MSRRLKESMMRALVFMGLALVITLLNHRATINLLARSAPAGSSREGQGPAAVPKSSQAGVIQTVKATPRDIRPDIEIGEDPGCTTCDVPRPELPPVVVRPAPRRTPPTVNAPAYLRPHGPGRPPDLLSPPA